MKRSIAKVADIKPDSSRIAVVAGKKYMVANVNGDFRVFENFCPHMGGGLMLAGKLVKCNWHGATFDAATGEAMSAPASEGTKLKRYDVAIEDGCVVIDDAQHAERSPWADDF